MKKENDPLVLEFEGWLELIKTGALQGLYKILREHQQYCRKEALLLLKQQQDRKADCERAKADDIDWLIGKIKIRMNELEAEVRSGKEE